MFWIALLVLLCSAVVLMFWPLLRQKTSMTVLDHAILQHASREEELARQYAAGLMTAQEHKAASIEQARQLLALQAKSGAGNERARTLSLAQRKSMIGLALLGVPVLAIGLYLRLGQPALPDSPLVARMAQSSKVASINVEDATAKLEAHLLKNPDDGKGFEVIAPVYMRMERFSDAAHAYGRVVALLGETPERLTDWGESQMAAAGGVITPEAQAALERAVALDSNFAKARFYLARLKEQNGDNAGAYQALVDLAALLPPGMPQARVREEIERFHVEGKAPAGSRPPAAAEAIASLPAPEQAAMIRNMVDGLSARLAEKGGNAEEWLRLITARMVLGEREAAIAHLTEAKTLFKDNAEVMARFLQLEQSILTVKSEPKP